MGHVLLVGLGSSGDLNPLLGLAEGLSGRGHRITLLSAPRFAAAAESVGSEFVPLGTSEAYDAVYAHPDLWHPRKGLGVFFPYAAGLTAETLRAIEERHRPGETVVVATFQCFGARLARELLDVPTATVLPNPVLVQSVHDPNRNPVGNPPRWMGRWASRWMYRITNAEVSRHARAGLNRARRARGLSPVRDVVSWCYSPDLVVGLWPSLLSAPQPDWPAVAVTTGFIPYDGPSAQDWDPPSRDELPDRDDWIVFTPGTRMTHGRAFFEAAIGAARLLDRPALLVTSDPAALPDPLPSTIRHLPFAPFTWLFRRAAVVVHHGGIGTAGRALQAGLPQVIVPRGFDQFDNAARVARLGCGTALRGRRLNARRLAEAIRRMSTDGGVRSRCRAVADALAATDPLADTCSALERLWARPVGPSETGPRSDR